MYYHRPGGWQIGQRMDDSYGEAATYDKNGNILTMNRTGELLDAQQAVAIDNLTYTYNGNQLQTVTDATNNTDGFKDGNTSGTDYFYDSFGNITQDLNKGITAVSYNHLSLPYQVTFANGGKINYTYDAVGTRLSKKIQPSGGALVTIDYVNGFQYTDNVLKFFPHPEGYVEFKNNQYLYTYQYKDHLGNIRLTYRDGYRNHPTLEYAKDGVIQVTEIIEENNYYPFGLKHKGYNDLADYSATNKYKYAYGGKELNDELGLDLYDFGARNYDAAIGRWLNVDPLAEQFYEWTPYNYAYNDPINWIDPTGMGPERDYRLNIDGSFTQLNDATTPDRVFNGSGEFVELEYDGQIQAMKKHEDTSVMKFNDISKSTEAFEFFAEHSNVEWGQIKTDNRGYVLTDNKPLSVGVSGYTHLLLASGFNVVEENHSHPVQVIGGETPSGYGHNPTKNNLYSEPNPYRTEGDYLGMRELIYGGERNGIPFKGFGDKARKINYRVYNPVTKTYIKYDEQKAVKEQ